jgi:hypothetical protein
LAKQTAALEEKNRKQVEQVTSGAAKKEEEAVSFILSRLV